MTALRIRVACTLVLALLTLARASAAHEFWIEPSRWDAARGTTIELSAVAGTGFRGERKPWSPDHAVRWVLRSEKPIDLARAASPGDMTWTRFAPSDDGGAMVAFESGFLPIELPAAAFDDYLRAEGLDAPLAARKGTAVPGRERYRRCAKTWLAGAQATRATAPVGMPLELVPEAAPGSTRELRLRVLWNGRPLSGALVKAWRTPFSSAGLPRPAFERDSASVAWRGRSDAAGAVTIPVRDDGAWLVSAVHMERMERSHAAEQADWESTWASLAFARAERAINSRAASSPAARGNAARP